MQCYFVVPSFFLLQDVSESTRIYIKVQSRGGGSGEYSQCSIEAVDY